MSVPPRDRSAVTVSVAVSPAEAFRIFTQEIDLWWRRGQRFRNAPGGRGIVCLEPGAGDRVLESFDTPGGERVVKIGRTRIWDPPHRLLFEWRSVNFAPNERTEVEVWFRPSATGTTVSVVHRGWSEIRADLCTLTWIRRASPWRAHRGKGGAQYGPRPWPRRAR